MVLLPELALDDETCQELVKRLKQDFIQTLQLLVTGVKVEKDGKNYNVARVVYMGPPDKNDTADRQMVIQQKKHHRWKIDGSQIRSYSIGDGLDPKKRWWEDIDIDDRELNFWVFRQGASFTTLICEDLARIDPCHSVIRALGPNIVFALLMDGPQVNGRWPERYALGLSDDPGSSVLSVTSMGLVERSNHHFNSDLRAVALWRDSQNGTKELTLPKGSEALLLNLTCEKKEEKTLDNRSDGESAYMWVLSGFVPVSRHG